MKYLMLVATELPEIQKNLNEDKKIRKIIKERKQELYELKRNGGRWGKMWQDFKLARFWGFRNSFSRAVYEAVEREIDPFDFYTEDLRYLSFFDIWSQIVSEYEDSTHCENFSKGNDLSKKSYQTVEDYAKAKYKELYNETKKAYGLYRNLNYITDGWFIGGYARSYFLVKATCKDYALGDYMKKPKAPKGYKWVFAARKKDIEWKLMQQFWTSKLIKRYQAFVNYFEKGEYLHDPDIIVENDTVQLFGEVIYKKGESKEEFLARYGIYEGMKYWYPYEVILTGGEVTYTTCFVGYKQKNTLHGCKDFGKKMDTIIDSFKDEAVMVCLDCHV